MLKDVILCLLVVVITVGEVLVGTWEGRADRQSTYCATSYKSRVAAGWATVFEALLYAGMILIARQEPWLAIPGCISAGSAKYWALEQRRKKWRARVRRKKTSQATGILQQVVD